MPSLDDLQADLGGEDFSVVAISVDRGGARVAKPFLDKLGLDRLDLYLDPDMSLARSMGVRSEEHTSELQSLMRISYAVFCLHKNIIPLLDRSFAHSLLRTNHPG